MQPSSIKVISKGEMPKILNKPAQIAMMHVGVIQRKVSFHATTIQGLYFSLDPIPTRANNQQYHTEGDHVNHLRLTFELLRKHELYIKKSKCQFNCSQVEYLGHLISSSGVVVDPQKVQEMMDWPEPKNVKELRGFLGLTGYYRHFMKDYGKIAKPFTELLQKGGFTLTVAATHAFHALKKAICNVPVLALPVFSKKSIIETDASIYEKEMMAIIIAVQKWRPYLIGRHFTIKTNNQSLKYLLEHRISTPSQKKWLFKLMDYEYTISYKKGKENVVADALSRRRHDIPEQQGTLSTLVTIQTDLVNRIKTSWVADTRLQKLITTLEGGYCQNKYYEWRNQVLTRKGKLVVGNDKKLRNDILKLYHDGALGGHSGKQATLQRIKQWLYWKGLKQDVHEFIKFVTLASGVKLHTSTAYHPQSDGQTEVVNRCLEGYLRCICHDQPKEWSQWFSLAEWCPFQIIQRIGKVAYRLDLPPHNKIHSTFHVSQLKKYHGDSIALLSLPVMRTPHGHLILEPEAILDKRIISFHNRPLTQIFVKWFNTPTKDSTWENYYEFKQKFPNFGGTISILWVVLGNVPLKFVFKKNVLRENLRLEEDILLRVIRGCLTGGLRKGRRLKESLHELINMLVQYDTTTEKSTRTVLVGEASTSKAKGRVSGQKKRKKDETSCTTASTLSALIRPLSGVKKRGRGFISQ
ncbi:Retrovirus-related Pol polyprotein from transposon [Sesamum angolense]|uniref:Retrovirus-related Pol polyprotein from transposon n=1 Tax=Sesamum angolense TaxID=2727404 RepID=A0AAE1WQE7_9LAMI|nr:Retrovirus-related Pol polyprotein from transposon [Sesamum angolense]